MVDICFMDCTDLVDYYWKNFFMLSIDMHDNYLSWVKNEPKGFQGYKD